MTQKEALDLMLLGHNIYLTGAAGTGKTFLLNRYISILKQHRVPIGITASTGIASTHMGGITIQSWSGIGIKDQLTDTDIERLKEKLYLKMRILGTKVLIIDEISMLHAYQLDMVDEVCRRLRNTNQPFGGIQVILCGDFFQLPPVIRDGSVPKYVTESRAWKTMNLMVCYLTRAFRQQDQDFLDVLSAIRSNSVGDHELQLLAKSLGQRLPNSSVVPTKIYTHNIDVDAVNLEELAKISGEPHEYMMKGTGVPALVDLLKSSCLSPEKLVLKKGAQVMFVKNNFERGYVNGTRGAVIGFDSSGYPIVQLVNGKKLHTIPESWSIDENGVKKAEIIQIPLRLAWAITVHKSQGMSLDAAEMDLNKAFVPGMGYVALSRVRTLRGINLQGINDMALRVDPKSIVLDQELRRASERSVAYVASLGWIRKFLQKRKYMRVLTS